MDLSQMTNRVVVVEATIEEAAEASVAEVAAMVTVVAIAAKVVMDMVTEVAIVIEIAKEETIMMAPEVIKDTAETTEALTIWT